MADVVSYDDKQVQSNLSKMLARISGATLHSNEDVGNEILRLSDKEVPHDKGILEGTGTVQPEGTDVMVGYNTPYAARLHEHPEYEFQRGRKGKYLEDPIKRNLRVLGLKWGQSVAINLLHK